MFNFIKNKLSSLYSHLSTTIHSLFSKNSVDEQTLKELEAILIAADTGVKTTNIILNTLRTELHKGNLQHGTDLKRLLEQQLIATLSSAKNTLGENQPLYLLVGINGSGKTTSAGKLAYTATALNKKVLLVAADTFRAAATQQLKILAQKAASSLCIGKETQDPASVVFAGCQQFKDERFDTLIIDTAGRLQTKTNLMRELEKIKRTIHKQLPDTPIVTLLTIDAMLGQNSLEQARLFHESTAIDGIILTKMDGTAKGGIVFAIQQELNIPVVYISYGESMEQLKRFDAHEYVQQLLAE